jgi:tetratricopeptide (TPR) repeat protein
MFLGQMSEAKALLDGMLKTDPKSKEAWTELAFLYGMSSQWPESYQAALRALASERHYRPAQIAQASALYAMGRFDEALQVTRDLYDAAPADGQVLLLHAKVTHSAHAFQEEIEVLQRLIGLMQGRSQPVSFWQIYLGQAYAATGNALLAEDQFKSALKDESLPASDRDFVLKAMERLETNSDTVDTTTKPAPVQSSLLDAPVDHL